MVRPLDLHDVKTKTRRDGGAYRWHRIGWFALIWAISVLALGAVATLIRAILL